MALKIEAPTRGNIKYPIIANPAKKFIWIFINLKFKTITLTPIIIKTIIVLKVVSNDAVDEKEIEDAKNKKNKNGPHKS